MKTAEEIMDAILDLQNNQDNLSRAQDCPTILGHKCPIAIPQRIEALKWVLGKTQKDIRKSY